MKVPGAEVFEGLAGAVVAAFVGSLFAAMDAALSSLNPARVSALLDESKGLTKAGLARYLKSPTSQQSRWLAGRVVCMSLAAVLTAEALSPYVPPWALPPLGALGALLTYGTFAEIGITLARSRADAFALRILPFLRPLELLVLPLAAPLSALGQRAARWMGPDGPRDARQTETEVEWVVAEGQKHGALGQEPAEMIRNVLELKDLVARDVMVPRTRVSAIEVGTPLPEVLRFVASEGHSRFPVYRDQVDNVIGLLYAKDLFRLLRDDKKQQATPLVDLLRAPVNFVPEMQGVSSVLREMRARRLHLAVVIDEFGGVSGIVTLEDILEVIVGEIRDEYDTEEAPIQDLGDGRLLADAAVSVHDLSAYLGAEIPELGDYESLGGLLIHHAGKVPAVGERLEAFDLAFIVRDADEKRISKVEIIRPRPLSDLPPSANIEVAPPGTSAERRPSGAPGDAPGKSPTGDDPGKSPTGDGAPGERSPTTPPSEPKRGPDEPRKIAATT